MENKGGLLLLKRLLMDDETIRRMAEEKVEERRIELAREGILESEIESRVEMSLEKIYRVLKTFNDDFKTFILDTESDDELQVVLRGHLYIESELTKMIRLTLVYPDEILNHRFMYMNKVNLAISLGILKKENKTVFQKINSLRNNFAHNLDFNCEERHYIEIYDAFVGELKTLGDKYIQFEEKDLLNKLRNIIGVVWIYVRREHAILLGEIEINNQRTRIGELFLKNQSLSEELKKLGDKADMLDISP